MQKNSLFIIKFAVKSFYNPPSFKGSTAEQQCNPPTATQPQQTDHLRPASLKLTAVYVSIHMVPMNCPLLPTHSGNINKRAEDYIIGFVRETCSATRH